jgi:hypothetical protein
MNPFQVDQKKKHGASPLGLHHGGHLWNQQIMLHKNPKEGSNIEFVGTPMEVNIVVFFSSNFWVTIILINSSNYTN